MSILHRPRMSRRQARAAGLVTIVAAVVAAAVGVAYAFFSTSTSSANTFSLGTVALTLNSPATTTCTYPKLQPGDLTGAAGQTCVLSVTYAGTISAYESLTIQVQSKAGIGGTPLFDGSEHSDGTGGNGLTLSVSDGHSTFAVPSGSGAPCVSPAGYTCWTASYDLASTYSGATPLVFTNGAAATFTLTPKFMTSAGNAYEGGTATVILTAQAVQAPANTLPTSCTIPSPQIGQPCSGAGFAWR